MEHYEKLLPTKRRAALLITLIVGCSMYGGVGRASYLCKYTMPFSFSLKSETKMTLYNTLESNWNMLFLSMVAACSPSPMV